MHIRRGICIVLALSGCGIADWLLYYAWKSHVIGLPLAGIIGLGAGSLAWLWDETIGYPAIKGKELHSEDARLPAKAAAAETAAPVLIELSRGDYSEDSEWR